MASATLGRRARWSGLFLRNRMHCGHVTAWARDGVDALALVDSFKPELVLLDIGMPGLSGYEVARRLRQDPQHRGLNHVALAGWGADEDRLRSREAGFDRHWCKPADPATLLALLQSLSEKLDGCGA